MIHKPDLSREKRCGIPEVVYGRSKPVDDLASIARSFINSRRRVIITKLSAAKASRLSESFSKSGVSISYHSKSGVMVLKKKGFRAVKGGLVGILAAGTSDIPVAEEAGVILKELGCSVISEYDVGIAGLHRLFPALSRMRKAAVLVVVAGMEGALPSVVSGLVKVPVIGVPTSVGYGVGAGGIISLCTMLNSCSPVAVVNIDNGYGAAALAYKIAVQHK